MKTLVLSILALGLIVSGGANRAFASKQAQTTQAVDKTAPSYDMKAQSIQDLQDMQKKYTSLAEAIPADKYTWRPGEGSRSVSELLLHVSAAGFGIPTMMGTAPAPDFKPDGFEKSTTDKAKIIEQLNKAFAYSDHGAGNVQRGFRQPPEEAWSGCELGDVVYILIADAHEHLGQFIAYARINGVVPPWTAEAMKKKAQLSP